MTDYVDAARIAEIVPFTQRQIIAYAKQGIIPGAFQIVEGGKWCFDEFKAKQYFKAREALACQNANQTYTKEVKRGGSKLSAKATESTNPLMKLLWPKQENTATGRMTS